MTRYDVKRYDVLSPRKGRDGKTRWLRLGVAFPRDAGGFSVEMDALPLPDAEGRVRLLLAEPMQEGDRQDSRNRSAPPQSAPQQSAVDPFGGGDDIPF